MRCLGCVFIGAFKFCTLLVDNWLALFVCLLYMSNVIYIYIYIYICARAHTHTHTRTHTHTHTFKVYIFMRFLWVKKKFSPESTPTFPRQIKFYIVDKFAIHHYGGLGV